MHWIEDLLQLNYTTSSSVRGIDIGTGASVIYPLLGHRLNHWSFLATDIDSVSILSAKQNIEKNDLMDVITILKVEKEEMLQELFTKYSQQYSQYDFMMCNPPFFNTTSEADTNPSTCCTGSSTEMTTPGGEVAFIIRIISDSLLLTDKIIWYTSLIGRKSSLVKIIAHLRQEGIGNVHTTTFYQGRTLRWGIAWSFTSSGLQQSTTASIIFSVENVEIVEIRRRLIEDVDDKMVVSDERISKEKDTVHLEFQWGTLRGVFCITKPEPLLLLTTTPVATIKVQVLFLQGERKVFSVFAERLKNSIQQKSRKYRRRKNKVS